MTSSTPPIPLEETMNGLSSDFEAMDLTEQQTMVYSLDCIFSLFSSEDFRMDEIAQITSDIGAKVFDETLVRAFIKDASIKGVQGFLKSYHELEFSFSLKDLAHELICNDEFSNLNLQNPYSLEPDLSNGFWDKRIHLFETFPCRDSLYAHLKELHIIPAKDGGNASFFSVGASNFFRRICQLKSFAYGGHTTEIWVEKTIPSYRFFTFCFV